MSTSYKPLYDQLKCVRQYYYKLIILYFMYLHDNYFSIIHVSLLFTPHCIFYLTLMTFFIDLPLLSFIARLVDIWLYYFSSAKIILQPQHNIIWFYILLFNRIDTREVLLYFVLANFTIHEVVIISALF